ncbi:hypothetical protein AAF712_011295 [Marasmius tenuissimus]|uniref:Uncharacterized protein n=1 Tax=Marasmius tenuissimus TaxID=585030 RepID=A0ABR2ZKE8_9AGAR
MLQEAGFTVTVVDSHPKGEETDLAANIKDSKVVLLPHVGNLWELGERAGGLSDSMEVQRTAGVAISSWTGIEMYSASRSEFEGRFMITKYNNLHNALHRQALSLGVRFLKGRFVTGVAMSAAGGTAFLSNREQLQAHLIVVAISRWERIAEMEMAPQLNSDGTVSYLPLVFIDSRHFTETLRHFGRSFGIENGVILGKLFELLRQYGLDMRDVLQAFQEIRAARKAYVDGLNFEVVAVSRESNIHFEKLRYSRGLEGLITYNMEEVVNEWWQNLGIFKLRAHGVPLEGNGPVVERLRAGVTALQAQSSDLSQLQDHGDTHSTSDESRPLVSSFLESSLLNYPPAAYIPEVPARPDTRASHYYDEWITEGYRGKGTSTVTLEPRPNSCYNEDPNNPLLLDPFASFGGPRTLSKVQQYVPDIRRIHPELAYWYTAPEDEGTKDNRTAPQRPSNLATPIASRRGVLPLVRKSSESSHQRMSVLRGTSRGLYAMLEGEGDR